MLIDSITKDADRQRETLTKIEELAASIDEVGLINPITVTPEGVLVAGERRLEACRMLGWTSIPVHVMEPESKARAHVIELEENVKREALPWQDYVKAIGRYRDQTGKSVIQLAKDLSMSDGNLNKICLVYNNMEEVADADVFSTAYNLISRKLARKRDAALANFPQDGQPTIQIGHPSLVNLENLPSEPAHTLDTREDTPKLDTENEDDCPEIVHIDFKDWLKTYSGRPFNFFHCDFPYGVSAGSGSGLATARYETEYQDTPAVYFDLLETFCSAMPKIRQASAHMIFWFSMNFYAKTKEMLEVAGWRVDTHPFIWQRQDGTGIIPDPNRTFRRNYETALFCTYGDRKIVKSGKLSHSFFPDKKLHPSAKPVEFYRYFIRTLIDETTEALDPTCGGGQILRSIKDSYPQARVLGLEKEEEYYNRAVDNMKYNQDPNIGR